MRPARTTALLVAAALALPASALAQSAGDEQYSDPFAQDPAQAPQAPAETQVPAQAPQAPAETQVPAPEDGAGQLTPAPPSRPAGGIPEGQPLATDEPQLPATGGDTGGIALLGAGLLLSGFGLRLRAQGA